jgi:hypothetical protein
MHLLGRSATIHLPIILYLLHQHQGHRFDLPDLLSDGDDVRLREVGQGTCG